MMLNFPSKKVLLFILAVLLLYLATFRMYASNASIIMNKIAQSYNSNVVLKSMDLTLDNFPNLDHGSPGTTSAPPGNETTKQNSESFIQIDVINKTSTFQGVLESDTEPNPDSLSPTENTKDYQRTDQTKRQNVVFLMADDMRPQLGAYLGDDYPTQLYQREMFTPNFDRLAKQSLVFGRNYVQYSLCGPSRTSMLTSRRPDVTRIFGNHYYWRSTSGNFMTIPQYFKSHGYQTIGLGKVFHPSVSSNNSDPISWTEPFYSVYSDGKYEGFSHLPGWNAVSSEARKEGPLTDEYAVNRAIERLQALAPAAVTGEQPFFLALGFRKPHISLICPKEYFELYPLETDKQYLSDVSWQTPHVGFPMENSTEIDGQRYIPDATLRDLRRAYFACISYVDHLLGQILDTMENLKLMDNTVISFIADHGYHLGENNHWGKYIPSEIANHVPTMIRIPGKTDQGMYTKSLTEAVDIFPTVTEAAGLLPPPSCPRSSFDIELCTDGRSLMPLFEDPKSYVKHVAISQVVRGNRLTEYSLRTDRYRYIARATMVHKQKPSGKFDLTFEWNPPGSWTQLYDHKLDPDERYNMTGDPDYKQTIEDLQQTLESKVTPLYDVPVQIP